MEPLIYLQSLSGKVFKILPMRESELNGELVYLTDYIDSLLDEATGACNTFPVLSKSSDYISVINILNYLDSHSVCHSVCKREVFKMLGILNDLQTKIKAGDSNV